MRELTSTLLTTQKKGSGIPYLKIEASNKISGIARLDWQRLYEGSEVTVIFSSLIAKTAQLSRDWDSHVTEDGHRWGVGGVRCHDSGLAYGI